MFILLSSVLFIALTSAIGIYLSRHVHTVKEYALAGRSLPLFLSTGTVFATWFGAEAVMGVPESFMEHGLIGIVSDPIGAFFCLITVGLFFARRFYQMNLISLVDFFYNRYGKRVEILLGIAICLSYVGWIAAQFTAFGSLVSFMSGNLISLNGGIIIGVVIIVLYTFKGGMLAVAINDFIQAVIISASLAIMSFYIIPLAGGIDPVLDYAAATERMAFRFDGDYPNFTYLAGVLLAMILGSIPQQDTFQRVTSAKSAKVALQSTLLGAFIYFFVTLMPILIVLAAAKIQEQKGQALPADFNVYILHFVIEHTPSVIQFFFFGSLFAAILSTASGTLLATSVVLSRNVLSEFFPKEGSLLATRLTLVMTTLAICIFSILSESSIHELVEDSGKISMVTAFFPLIFGMFWKKTNKNTVLPAILLSTSAWLIMVLMRTFAGYSFAIAPELVGTALSGAIIFFGSRFFPSPESSLMVHHRHMHS